MHLVLLPGMDGTGELFRWLKEALPEGIRVSVVRYPRDEPLDWNGLMDVVQRSIPDHAPFVLVAESFSGPLAVDIAAQRPPDLHALVLCCTYASNPLPWFLRWMRWLARPRFFRQPLPVALIRRSFLSAGASEDLVSAISQAVGSVAPQVLSQRVAIALDRDVEGELGKIDVPTLPLTANQDRILGRHCRDKLQSGLPHAKHVALDGPHLLLQQNPEEAAAAITDFLRT